MTPEESRRQVEMLWERHHEMDRKVAVLEQAVKGQFEVIAAAQAAAQKSADRQTTLLTGIFMLFAGGFVAAIGNLVFIK